MHLFNVVQLTVVQLATVEWSHAAMYECDVTIKMGIHLLTVQAMYDAQLRIDFGYIH